MQNRIFNWLRSFSGLEKMTEEWIGDLPGCAGLFYQGCQEVSRTADILGNEILRQRLRWKLVTNTAKPVEIPSETAPVLGLLQTVRVEKAHLTYLDEMELPRWEAELTIEFTASPDRKEAIGEKL